MRSRSNPATFAASASCTSPASSTGVRTPNPLAITPLGDPEPHLPGSRMNDGKADASGAIWCGTMDMAEEQDAGALYRLDPDGSWAVMDSGYRVPRVTAPPSAPRAVERSQRMERAAPSRVERSEPAPRPSRRSEGAIRQQER